MTDVATLAVPRLLPQPREDPRLEVMRGLVVEDWLPGEWDPVRLVLTPRRGSLLDRMRPCLVPDCAGTKASPGELCRPHARQFDRAGVATPEAWIAANGPSAGSRRLGNEHCVVISGGASRCARIATDPWGLCVRHMNAWKTDPGYGKDFTAYLAKAQPLASFGYCAAACCYREAAERVGLCRAHYNQWIADGRPRGRAHEAWLARVRDLANGRVVSLRGLPELVRLEILYALQRRVAEQAQTPTQHVRRLANHARVLGAASLLELDLTDVDATGTGSAFRFARYACDRAALAYADPEVEQAKDRWNLRVFGRKGALDFSTIRQEWLREGVKHWAAVTMHRHRGDHTLQARVKAIVLLSEVLAAGPGGGTDPATLTRRDVDRFLTRTRSLTAPSTGEALSEATRSHIVKDVAVIVREATAMGFFPGLHPTFSFRRGDGRPRVVSEEPGRALPAHVVAQLDGELDLLRDVPGLAVGPNRRLRGVLGEHSGAVAVLAYKLLKGTGRRLGELASLRLDCLDVDETEKPVLVYDNHKAGRLGRRLPLADSALVEAIRIQQRWVVERFPETPRGRLWLLPGPLRNGDGTTHIGANRLGIWFHRWVMAIPIIEAAPAPGTGAAIAFDRSAITPHAFRHTYAQTLADEGVAPSVLRDLMDHRNMDTTLAYYRVGEAKKRKAMELLARLTIDNRATARPAGATVSRTARLREELSWVAVPMGKCSEPTNVRAGGQGCPIRYQCAGCPHFESDPSYLPELRSYADDLRREREVLIAFRAADWVVANVTGQLDVIVEHIQVHEGLLDTLSIEERGDVDEASRTLRKVRQSVPVAFGRRRDRKEKE